MNERRRWKRAVFEQNLRHPLVGRFMRGLVWTSLEGGQALQFRIAEDGRLEDVNELPITLGSAVVLAHPADMEAELLARWSSLFADYTILQPFQQLGRDLPVLTPEESSGTSLLRFQNAEVSTNRLLQLLKRDWRHRYTHLSRSVPGIGSASIEVTPGFFAGMQNNPPTVTVVKISGEWGKADPAAVGEFILAMETLRAEKE